jgi:hypothetical protein
MTAASDAYLNARLERLRDRVRDAMSVRRAGDPDPEDRFRGLYITDAQADATLDEHEPLVATLSEDAELEAWADEFERDGEDLHLRNVARAFGLSPLEVEMLLVASAPDLDQRFERVYGYLHDDVTRRRASVGLAIELCGGSPMSRTSTRFRW